MIFYLSMIDTQEEKDKFETLYHKYSRLMKYVADGILHDEYLAQDAVHIAFMKIIPNLGKIGDIACHKTKAFVVIVVENEAKRIYTARKKQNTVSFDEIQYEVADADGGLEQIISDLTVEEIAAEIEKLSKLDRDILMLRYIHELTHKEIARLLDVKGTTVRKRLERARQRLAMRLGKER